MNKLEELLIKIEQNNKILNVNVDDVPRINRPGYETALRQAKDAIGELKKEYQKELFDRAWGLFLSSSDVNEHEAAHIAEEEGAFSLNVDEFYDSLAQAIEPQFGNNRMLTINQISNIMNLIRKVGAELDVHMMIPRFQEIMLENASETAAYIRQQVEGVVGNDFVREYLRQRLLDKALETRYTANVVPVVVIGNTESSVRDLKGLFGKGCMETNLDEKTAITVETLQELFSKGLKKNKTDSE